MVEKFNVTVKRTSDKLRNPQNKATVRELQVISDYNVALKNNTKLTPVVEMNNDKNIQNIKNQIIRMRRGKTCRTRLFCVRWSGTRISKYRA